MRARILIRVAAGGLFALASACAEPVLDEPRLASAQAIALEVRPERVFSEVTALAAQHLNDTPLDCDALFDLERIDQARRPVCNLTHDQARGYIVQRFKDLGLTVTKDPFDHEKLPTVNIVAELPGTDLASEVVLVGAHYDAFYQGADDNSSGVAAMLELAEVLRGHSFRRTIRFVAFDLEELGLVGSTRLVETKVREEDLFAAMIFDCVGYADPTPGSQSSLPGLPVPDRGDFIAIIANDGSAPRATEIRALSSRFEIMPTETVIAPSDGAFPITGNLMRSDHAPFWLAGKPAVFLTDTANFRNPNYHKESDTVDTLDPEFLGNVARLSAASVAYWAEVAP